MLNHIQKVFRALAQPTRLKMALLLANRSLCVCELEDVFQMSQPAISQHMRVFRDAGLVREARQGQWVFYVLNRDHLVEILQALSDLLDKDPGEIPGLQVEADRIRQLEKNPKVNCERPEGL